MQAFGTVAAAHRVLVDVRERRSGMPEALAGLGLDVVVGVLPVGDYVIGRSIVERKSGPDLRRSVESGRIWTQLWRAASTDRRAYLLVEDVPPPAHDLALRGAVLTAVARGIGVLFSNGRDDSAHWLALIGRRDHGPPVARRRIDHRAKRTDTHAAAERSLAAIPGVSLTIARALLDRFDSPAAVAAASPEELRTVAGVGSQRARAIVATLQAPREPAS